MKVVIAGGSGLLGANLAAFFSSEANEVICLSKSYQVAIENVSFRKIDLNHYDDVHDLLNQLSPDLTINAAGFTNVGQCERFPKLAWSGNVSIAENLARISSEKSIRFFQISTDHLFDGESEYYNESSVCHPLNKYAKTKYEAEKKVLLINPEALICRVNFFGHGAGIKASFSDWVIENLSAGKKIYAYEDVYITPILIDNLANILNQLYFIKAKGIYNISSDEKISKYSFAKLIAKIFHLDDSLIVAVKYKDSGQTIVRPLDMSLSNKKLKSLLQSGLITSLIDNIQALKLKEAWIVKEF